MLLSNPEVTENTTKGKTPGGSWQARNPLKGHPLSSKLTAFAAASAYRHVTRMTVSGQRTGRGFYTSGRAGVPS